jgi:hypothetical protein
METLCPNCKKRVTPIWRSSGSPTYLGTELPSGQALAVPLDAPRTPHCPFCNTQVGLSTAVSDDETTASVIKLLLVAFGLFFAACWLITSCQSTSARREEIKQIADASLRFFPAVTEFDLFGNFDFNQHYDFVGGDNLSPLLLPIEHSGAYAYKDRKRVYDFLRSLNNSIYFMNSGSKKSMDDPGELRSKYNKAKARPSLLIELPEVDKRASFALRKYEEFYKEYREQIEAAKREHQAEIDEIAREQAEEERRRQQQQDDYKAQKFKDAWGENKR